MIRGQEHAPADHFTDNENRRIDAPAVPASASPKGKGKIGTAKVPSAADNIHRIQVLGDADIEALSGMRVRPEALEKLRTIEIGELEKMRIKPAEVSKLYKQLKASQARGGVIVDFINQFHDAPGFESVVLGWAKGKASRTGANFAMKYSLSNLKGRSIRFEWPVGVARTSAGAEGTMAARYVDIVVEGGNAFRPGESLRIELKSWTQGYISFSSTPRQIAKQLHRAVA